MGEKKEVFLIKVLCYTTNNWKHFEVVKSLIILFNYIENSDRETQYSEHSKRKGSLIAREMSYRQPLLRGFVE